jgi:hypothetical protein
MNPINIFKRLQEALDRRGVRIENRHTAYKQADPRTVFGQLLDRQQRTYGFHGGLPPLDTNADALGHDPSSSDNDGWLR